MFDRLMLFGGLLIIVLTHLIMLAQVLPEDQQLIHAVANLLAAVLIFIPINKANVI